jgi:hypothetical protein
MQCSYSSIEPRLFLEIVGYNFSKLSETALHESALPSLGDELHFIENAPGYQVRLVCLF